MTTYHPGDATGRLPDLPGIVHGIVSLNPPTVQCDGCGALYSHNHLGVAVLTSGIVFNPKVNDGRRMCSACWRDAGWIDDNLRGFIPA